MTGNDKRIMKRNSLIALLIALMVSACSSDGVYFSDFRDIDPAGWAKQQSYNFVFPDSVVRPGSDLVLQLRHDNYYPYRNLYVKVDYFSHGKQVSSDDVNVALADKFGNWYGSGLGGLYQLSVPLRSNVAPGQFDEVMIWHNLRQDTVKNIANIGLALDKKE